MTNGSLVPPDEPSELDKLQFDYGWKWFSYHADQRVKMFNFMLVVFGIFAATVVNAVGSKQQPGFTAVLCAIGAALAAIFIALDTRNQYLLRLAEEVLCHLEENAIFGKGTTIKDRDGKDVRFGILSRQLSEERSDKGPPKIIRHRYLLPLVGVLMLASFVVAGIWIYLRPQ